MIIIMSQLISDYFANAPLRSLDSGAHLFLRGDPVREVFLLVEGSVELTRTSVSGLPMSLQWAGPGDILAEASVYSGQYHCDGILRRNSHLRAVAVGLFRKALQADPALHGAWAERLATQVQKSRVLSEIRGQRRLQDRLDMWLAEGNHLPCKGAWQDLAAELGVSREALYRELARRRS